MRRMCVHKRIRRMDAVVAGVQVSGLKVIVGSGIKGGAVWAEDGTG